MFSLAHSLRLYCPANARACVPAPYVRVPLLPFAFPERPASFRSIALLFAYGIDWVKLGIGIPLLLAYGIDWVELGLGVSLFLSNRVYWIELSITSDDFDVSGLCLWDWGL